jgi:hypothetical protein
VITVVAVFTQSCQVSEKLNTGPRTSHIRISKTLAEKAHDDPSADAERTEKERKHSLTVCTANPQ